MSVSAGSAERAAGFITRRPTVVTSLPPRRFCERGFLFVGDLLVADHQHAVAVHQRAHRVESGVVERAQIGAVQFAGEQRVTLLDPQMRGGHAAHDAGGSS